MRIDINSNYKVKQKGRFSVRVGYDEFEENEISETIDKVTGYELLKLLLQDVCGYSFTSMEVKGNKVFLELFNPNTGEDGSLEFEIKELKQELIKIKELEK